MSAAPAGMRPGAAATLVRWLYAAVMWLAQPFYRRKLAQRGASEPLYLAHMAERFGHYDASGPVAPGHTIWIHAVSLGEARAAAVLVAGLRQRLPGMRLLLTHGTATGRAQGLGLLQPGDMQTWLPWDSVGAVRRFLAHFQPRIGILIETEIWPNLIAACQHAGVPLVLANARMSAASQRRTQRLAWLARPAYATLDAVWAQTDDDARRLQALGASVSAVLGNLKFDATPEPAQLRLARQWRTTAPARAVLLLASSRAGEERALLQILQSNQRLAQMESAHAAIEMRADGAQWMIVPRHPQRFDEVASLIGQHGFAVARRSHWGLAPPPLAGSQQPVIWLGDTLGEMALYYGLADVALLGGSFEPLGGQNLIEAAACGCPLVMGEHTFNFAEAAELALQAGAALRAASLADAVQQALALAADPPARQRCADAAGRFAQAHQGVLQKTCDAVLAQLGPWTTPGH